MSGFFQELAKRLAERWVALLVLPGALFIAATWTAVHLGHQYALNFTQLGRSASDTIAALAKLPGATQAILAVTVLLSATGIGMATQALAGEGPWIFRIANPLGLRIRKRGTN
ncbi:MAG: hypothetical protein ACRDTE_03460 [Pseudonocardiaceae bacterium]